jgi:hypothetical protein
MIGIDYSHGRWVKVHRADESPSWKRLSWAARCVLLHLWRKLDQETGRITVDPQELERDVAMLIDAPLEVAQEGVAELLRRKVAVLEGDQLIVPEFLPAQKTPKDAAERKREQRERERPRGQVAREVTPGHAASREVTPSHEPSQNVTIRTEEKRTEETRSETPLPPKGAGAGDGKVVAVNGVEALAAIRAAAGERLSFGKPAASETGLPEGDAQGSESAWIRAWLKQGQGYSLADCAKLGAWLKAGGWGHLQPVPFAFLTSHLTEALQSAHGWDGAPLGKARASPGGGSKPPPMVRP